MDNERHALETLKTAPPGYALAFNGEPIKKSCETCQYLGDEGDGYRSCPVCNWNDGNSNLDRLPTWPFKNGCKYFELHWTYSVDWDAEANRMDAELEVCQYLYSGYCGKSFVNPDCDSAIPVVGGSFACEKAL